MGVIQRTPAVPSSGDVQTRARELGLDVARVAPKLWIGAYPRDRHATPLDKAHALARLHRSGFGAWVPVAQELPHAFALDDAEITDAIRDEARRAALAAKHFVEGGIRTLITCNMGLNRSALVLGYVLLDQSGIYRYGYPQAIGSIRHARPGALINKSFANELYFAGHRMAGYSLK